jgi:fucokinase
MAKLADEFLARTYSDCWRDFETTLTSETAAKWDYGVITASNEQQADAFRLQIDARIAIGRLPTGTQYLCIPDRDGKRVGSGGATLGALKVIAE